MDFSVLHNPNVQKKIMDTVLKGSPTLFLLLTNNPGQWKSTSVKKTIKYKNTGQGGAFNGQTQFETNQVNNKQSISFNPRWEYQPIVVDQTEVDQNESDPDAAANLVKAATQDAMEELGERLGSRIFGVGGADPVTGATMIEGLRALVDDTTEAATLGGLSRSTYTTLKSPTLDVNADLSSSTVANITTYFNKATVGTEAPDMFVTTRELWQKYEALLTLTQNANAETISKGYATRMGAFSSRDALGVNVGFESIFIKGRPLIADPQCPDYYLFGLNRKYLKFFGMKSTEEGATPILMGSGTEIEGPYAGMDSKNIGLFLRTFMKSPNQYGSTAQVIWGGSFTTFSPRHHFKLIFN
jgi:hypothetical protein